MGGGYKKIKEMPKKKKSVVKQYYHLNIQKSIIYTKKWIKRRGEKWNKYMLNTTVNAFSGDVKNPLTTLSAIRGA